jgi:hypothetical protein
MRQIYKGADVVVVWLGDDESLYPAMETIRALGGNKGLHFDPGRQPSADKKLLDHRHIASFVASGRKPLV